MKFFIDIYPDGKTVTEVIDREDSICGNIKTLTNALGTEESDEHIGPDCDRAEERQV